MKLRTFIIFGLFLTLILNYSVVATEMAKSQDRASEFDIKGYRGSYGWRHGGYGGHHHHHHGHHGHYGHGGYGPHGHGGYGYGGFGGRWGGRRGYGWGRGCRRFGCGGAKEAGAKNTNIEDKS